LLLNKRTTFSFSFSYFIQAVDINKFSSMLSKFDSITDVVNFLREPMLSATVTDSRIIGNGLKPSKKQRTEKNLSNVMSTTPQSEGNIQILPKGRVR
jgi:hypothetical protein